MRRVLLSLTLCLLSGFSARSAASRVPGTLDRSFAPDIQTKGVIIATAIAPGGQIYVAGWFTLLNGTGRTNLARLNPDGSVDASFIPSIDILTQRYIGFGSPNESPRLVSSILLPLAEGGLLISGWKVERNGPGAPVLLKVDRNGRLDPDFAPRFDGVPTPSQTAITGLALDDTGRILVAGTFSVVNGQPRSRVARLGVDGSLDRSFDAHLEVALDEAASINAMALESDGGLVLGGGWISTGQTGSRALLFRVGADGSWNGAVDLELLTGPGSGMSMTVRALAVQGDRRIVVAGELGFSSPLLRLNPDGSLDTDFRSSLYFGPYFTARQVAIETGPKGNLVLLGSQDGGRYYSVFRYGRNGALDPTLDIHQLGESQIHAIAPQPDGGTLIAGDLRLPEGWASLASIDHQGAPTPAPRASARTFAYVASIVSAPEGFSYISGVFDEIDGQKRNSLARLRPDGQLDETFNDSFPEAYLGTLSSASFWLLAVQPDSKLLILASGGSSNVLVRLDQEGNLDPEFQIHSVLDYYGRLATVQPDGKIVTAGITINDALWPSSPVQRLNPDGTLDASFTGNQAYPWLYIRGVAVQEDGRIMLGFADHGLVRLNVDGSVDESYVPPFEPGAAVTALIQDKQGRLIVGHTGPVQERALSRLLPNGTVDPSFLADLTGLSPFTQPEALAIQEDGKILVSLEYWNSNEVRQTVIRLNDDGSWDTGFEQSLFRGLPQTLALLSNGQVLAQGGFDSVDGAPRFSLALLQGGEPAPHAPVILSNPISATLFAGARAEFTVIGKGSPQPGYQWRHNGVDLPGRNGRTLSLDSVDPTSSGNYTVVLKNNLGSATSAEAVLRVIPTVPLEVALDNSELRWTTLPRLNPADSWVGVTDVSHDGLSSARNQPVGANESALLLTQFSEPGTLSFWWKVSSEAGYDVLQFSVGDNLLGTISGETEWRQITVPVKSGETALWVYRKDGESSSGADCGWVDGVMFTSAASELFRLRPSLSAQDGRVALRWSGEIGRAYSLQTSSNLVDWVELRNEVCPRVDLDFIEPEMFAQPSRFYRIIAP